ncbi:hypothetical protein GCM10009528_06760 [Kineococcus aurantiacus]
MQIGADLVPDPQSLELVQPGEAPLDDPAGAPEAGAVDDAAAGDARDDPACAQDAAVDVEVVATLGEQVPRA